MNSLFNMKITDNIIKEVWKEIIRLQYQKGSISDITLYKNKGVNEKGLATTLQRLESLKQLRYKDTSDKNFPYYVIVPEEFRDYIFSKGLYVNKTDLDGETLREFLNTAIQQINRQTLKLSSLGIETAPPLDVPLFREKQNLESILNNLHNKINIPEFDRNSSENFDRKEITYIYKRENKKEIKFFVSLSDTWLRIQDLTGTNLEQIEECLIKIILDYFYENALSLGFSSYKLKCVCSEHNTPSEDCILIRNVEELSKLKIKDLLLEKYI